MAYVFGIEGVPIFELLFVICVLLLLGLVFVLLELRKLTALIGKEKADRGALRTTLQSLRRTLARNHLMSW